MINKNEILTIEGLYANYNSNIILKNINFILKENEICCIIGEEGSGKSTLLKAITNQIKYNGIILYKGLNLRKISTNRFIEHKIDFLIQGGNILQSFTVEEHIHLAFRKIDCKETMNQKWNEIEKTFPNIMNLKKQIASRLSGGERLILSLACLIGSDAEMIILDEPTAGLAQELIKPLEAFINQLKNEKKKSIIILEHNYEFALTVADTVYILKDGTLSNKFTQNYFSNKTFIDNYLI
jgi:branched-chain amino acid transport system ATP-binding protein